MTVDATSSRIRQLRRQLDQFQLPERVREEITTEIERLQQLAVDGGEAAPPWPGVEAILEVPGLRGLRELADHEDPLDLLEPPSDGPLHRVLSMSAVAKFEKDVHSPDRDLERRNTHTLKKIRERGEFRDLVTLPHNWRNRLARLARRFENFAAPIEYLQASLYAADRGRLGVDFDPMLIDGPPGVGKTLFTENLSVALGLPMTRVDMASAQSSSAVVGSDIFWANTRPGRVFMEIVLGPIANPLFLLDELDKANGDDRFPSTGALYSLLERRTAAQFEDSSFPGIRFDASRVLWLGTCNNVEAIDRPIRDRMRVFTVQAPSPAAMRAMALQTVDSALTALRLPRRQFRLTKDVLAALAALPPRVMVRTIRESVALAAFRKGKVLAMPAQAASLRRQRIGFVH